MFHVERLATPKWDPTSYRSACSRPVHRARSTRWTVCGITPGKRMSWPTSLRKASAVFHVERLRTPTRDPTSYEARAHVPCTALAAADDGPPAEITPRRERRSWLTSSEGERHVSRGTPAHPRREIRPSYEAPAQVPCTGSLHTMDRLRNHI